MVTENGEIRKEITFGVNLDTTNVPFMALNITDSAGNDAGIAKIYLTKNDPLSDQMQTILPTYEFNLYKDNLLNLEGTINVGAHQLTSHPTFSVFINVNSNHVSMSGNPSPVGLKLKYKKDGESYNIITLDDKTTQGKWVSGYVQNNIQLLTKKNEIEKSEPEESIKDKIDNIDETKLPEAAKYQAFSNESKMIDFNNKLQTLVNRYNNGIPVYSLYLVFKCKGLLLVDTTSPEFNKNIFTKFQIEQNGSGVANKFTLTITYRVHENTLMDIDAIDKILLAATKFTDESGNLITTSNMNNYCEFVYGYGNEPSLRSQTYRGMILDYDNTIAHDFLEYVITGTAYVYVANETKFSKKPEHVVGLDEEHPDPFQFLFNFVQTEFSEKISVNNKRLFDIRFDKQAVNENGTGPNYLGAYNDLINVNNKTLYQIFTDVLAGCIHQTEADFFKSNKNICPTQKQIYNFYVDDIGDEECENLIWVYKVPSVSSYTSNGNEDKLPASANITFNWYGKSDNGFNHIVKVWKPNFSGSMLLTLACSLQKTGDEYVTITESGEVKNIKGVNSPRLGVKDTDTWATLNTAQEYSKWSSYTQYMYNATLTIQGVPSEVPMNGLVKVQAILGNKLHHSSGTYFITKKLDVMNNKRHQRIKNYIHNATAFVIKWCVENEIDTLVIGKNNTWKQEKKHMQNFTYIPYEMVLSQLQYKCENAGVKYIETNEAYTSGTSYLDDEMPVKENYNKNRRVQRGLFQAKNMLINADVNGSLQIMRKVFPDSYTGYGIEVDLTPTIVNVLQSA